MCHFFQAGRRLWKAPLVSQLFPFLWAEPHHADVSLFCEDRSWQNDFSNSRSRITAWVARFLLKRSWRTVPVARYLTNVSVCFIQLSKSCGENGLRPVVSSDCCCRCPRFLFSRLLLWFSRPRPLGLPIQELLHGLSRFPLRCCYRIELFHLNRK